MPDPQIRSLTLSCLLLSYEGPQPPSWLLSALADGLGGVVLFGSNLGDGRGVRGVTDRLRAAAGRDIVIAVDEEGGDVTRLDTVRGSAFPGAAALGHLDDVAATEEVYAAIGARLVEAGVTANLAPVADVNVDPLNPVIGPRSFSADPGVAARHVAAAVRGIQRNGIAACAKHFPGHGATSVDSHHDVPTLNRSRTELSAVEFAPFRAAIAGGVRAIMTGHLIAPALDDRVATVSRTVTTDVLRGELGFTGTVVTDALEMTGLAGTHGLAEGFVAALAAGADVVEAGAQEYPALVDEVLVQVDIAVEQGLLNKSRLRDAAERSRALTRSGRVAAYDRARVDATSRRAIEVIGRPPSLTTPLVIECRPAGGMASGDLPWSLGDVLAASIAGTETVSIDADATLGGIAARAVGRALVVVIRDPARHPWQRPWIRLAQTHPRAVVVDLGWPHDTITDVACVRTRGVAPALIAAAARVLTELEPDE